MGIKVHMLTGDNKYTAKAVAEELGLDGYQADCLPDDKYKKVKELQAQVDALRGELRRAQRLAAVGTMTAMVAHEFNNILTPIINYAQLAKNNPKMVPKAIARASEGGLRATEICKAILYVTTVNGTTLH